MKSRPVTRRSTCVDLNLPISNPDFACDNCKPFLDVTVNSRKKASDVSCAQPWSIKRWGEHREVRIVQKCKKVREFLGLGDEDTELIEEFSFKRNYNAIYNPIVKIKFDYKKYKWEKLLKSHVSEQEKALLEILVVKKRIEKNVEEYFKLSKDYTSSFGVSPPLFSFSK